MKSKIKKTICFDLDGVLCLTKGNNYLLSKPIKKNIKFTNKLNKDYKIIIFTSRFMGRNNDNVSKANKQGYEFTKKQLKKWNVKYSKLILGKPSYDFYIDDKNLGFSKNWVVDLKKILKL